MTTSTENSKLFAPPGAIVNVAGPTVRDLIAALEQIDPDARHDVDCVRTHLSAEQFSPTSGKKRLRIRFKERE